ncbi:glycerol kinase GlpK [Blastococcus sp. Marseille-P5729]|uniref:glycerol kinase GlpK n=1 Tax=Blastococcus sp. Marseille-P5729 TaxID=2086582 RepID=UPI000D0E4115|nr:glycerol kinase GlpK [Blastococcus sp. Marseille-P5729]
MAEQYILAIDQGTTSSRAVLVDHAGRIISSGQLEHEQILPRAGWVEHDPKEIWSAVRQAAAQALAVAEVNKEQVAAIGITNQRETAVVWDRTTGEPVYNAIVWQDTRTQRICDELAKDGGGKDRYKDVCGLPLATYFSGPKVHWILENVDGARKRAEAGDLLLGTIDSWLIWLMTDGVHVTDVTNASRTMLMDIRTRQWSEQICADLGIPLSMLPQIRSSSEVYAEGRRTGLLTGVPIASNLGDQHAAMVGQACFAKGDAKNTYGTGCFMLINTGSEPVVSDHGLLTTMCYQLGDEPPSYALEGSIAVTGSLIQWLRDNLGIISSAPEVEQLARTVDDNGGAYFVPAFSGLFAPYWRSDARGALVGLTRFVNKGHLARAALESTAYQTADVMSAMLADAQEGVTLTELKVDGGMTANDELMQFQADILDVPVIRPEVIETTALGAAYAAGLAVGFWSGKDEIRANWAEGRRWTPKMSASERDRLLGGWHKAVTKSFDWVDDAD